jgi:ketosteroid isomerase-like protein
MSNSQIEANKSVARAFIDAANRRDINALENLFHKDFIWNTAVTGDDEPNELRPMQSKALRGTNLPHWKPRLTREEALTVWRSLFQGQYEDAHMTASGAQATRAPSEEKPEHQLRMDVLGMTAEDDRVAMEAKSHMIHPVTGRRYHNLYHFLFRVRDGKLTLFKEYQDTLHIYDFLAE